MALDETVGGQKKPRKPRDMSRGPGPREEGVTPAPSQPLPKGRPVGALQKHGVTLGINEVNERVERITRAHERARGTKPSPGLVFDLLRAESRTQQQIDYDELLSIPRTKRAARTARVALPERERVLAREEMEEAWRKRGHEMRGEHGTGGAMIPFLLSVAMEEARLAGITRAEYEDALDKRWRAAKIGLHLGVLSPLDASDLTDPTQEFETLPWEASSAGLNLGPLKYGTRAVGQIVGMAADMPYGAYLMAEAVTLDLKDAAENQYNRLTLKDERNPAFSRSREMVKEMALQIADDFANPLKNPGYLIMDIWAIATLGAGGAARISAFNKARGEYAPSKLPLEFDFEDLGTGGLTRAYHAKFGGISVGRLSVGKDSDGDGWHVINVSVEEPFQRKGVARALFRRAEEDVKLRHSPRSLLSDDGKKFAASVRPGRGGMDATRAALPALLKRPVGGSFELGYNGYTAQVPLFDNAAMRAIQVPILERRQGRMVVRQTGDPDVIEPKDLIGRVFSTEAKVARERHVNSEILYALATAPLIEFSRMARWDARAKGVLSDVLADPKALKSFRSARARHKIGMEKAIQVLFTDDPDPVGAWRALHEREIATKMEQIRVLNESDLSGKARRTIRDLEYSINAHKIQLQALYLAEEIINNPPKRFQPFLEKAREVSRNQERIKRLHLGLDDDIANQAIAKTGAIVRGENLLDLGDGRVGKTAIDPDPILKKVERREKAVANAERRLNEAKKELRLHPGREDFKANVARLSEALERKQRSLGVAERQLQDLRERAVPLERLTDDSAYIPDVREVYSNYRLGRMPLANLRPSRFGIRPPEKPGSLRYRKTGAAIELGDFRWDVSALLIEESVQATKAAFTVVHFKDLWDSSKPRPTSEFDVPIRDVRNAPARLKQVVAAMEEKFISPERAALLTDDNLQELREWAAIDPKKIQSMLDSGSVKASEIRWVDERFIFERVGGLDTHFWRNVDNIVGGVMGPINEPMRMMLIFLTPAYFLNAGGNAALALIHQGPFALSNSMRGMRAERLYGPEVAARLDALGGKSFTEAMFSEQGVYGKFSTGVMEGWQVLTDRVFRRAAVIHELRRRGVLTDDMSAEEFLAKLNSEDPEMQKLVVEASRAAKQAMLDFDRMTWPEKATLRHFVFIYSFVRASAVWGARFYAERPVKATVLAQAGRDREEDLREALKGEFSDGEMTEWFVRHGYMPVGKGIVFDPVQFNMPSMLMEIAYPFASLFRDIPYASPSELLAPFPTAASRLVTGRDEQGAELPDAPGGRVGRTFLATLRDTPLGFAYEREQKAKKEKENPLPAPAIRTGPREVVQNAMAREIAALDHGSFENDSFWDTWGRSIGRSAIPYNVNEEAQAARHWRDLRETDPEKYVQHQINRVHEMVRRQEKAVGEKAPEDVWQAVDAVARVTIEIERFRSEHASTPSEKDIGMLSIKVLEEMGVIGERRAQELREFVRTARTPQEAKQARLAVLYDSEAGTGPGKAWWEWVKKVNDVTWFESPEYRALVEDGKAMGLGDYTRSVKASRETKWKYGREYLAHLAEDKRRAALSKDLSGWEARIADSGYRAWLMEQDKPVVIDGVEFPSPQRMKFLRQGPEGRAATVRKLTRQKFRNLDAFEKELLGQKPSMEAMKGWATLAQWMHEAKEQMKAEGKDLPNGTQRLYEDTLAQRSLAFKKELEFSRRIAADRMRDYLPIKNSPHASDWNWMLSTVVKRYNSYYQDAIDAGYTESRAHSWARKAWKEYDAEKMVDAINSRSQAFREELRLYMGDTPNKFFQSLVSDG